MNQQLPAILQTASQMGRKGDTGLAHVSEGDFVVPRDIILRDPEILQRMKQMFEDDGQDFRSHWVGSGHENINPATGLPEHGFLSKLVKSSFKTFFNPLKSLSNPMGIFGEVAAPLLGGMQPQEQSTPEPSGPQNAAITKPTEVGLPSTLGSFNDLDPFQRETALATQGSFGGGLGKDEQSYFLNLLQRRLIDDQGGYGDMNSVSPVAKNYLESNMGLKFDGNTKGLLQAIANRQAGLG
jgi:hypothetical protein